MMITTWSKITEKPRPPRKLYRAWWGGFGSTRASDAVMEKSGYQPTGVRFSICRRDRGRQYDLMVTLSREEARTLADRLYECAAEPAEEEGAGVLQ